MLANVYIREVCSIGVLWLVDSYSISHDQLWYALRYASLFLHTITILTYKKFDVNFLVTKNYPNFKFKIYFKNFISFMSTIYVFFTHTKKAAYNILRFAYHKWITAYHFLKFAYSRWVIAYHLFPRIYKTASVTKVFFQYRFSRRYEICFYLYGMQIIFIFIGQWMMTSQIFYATWQHCLFC